MVDENGVKMTDQNYFKVIEQESYSTYSKNEKWRYDYFKIHYGKHFMYIIYAKHCIYSDVVDINA